MQDYLRTAPFDCAVLLDDWKVKQVKLEKDESKNGTAVRFRAHSLRLDELKKASFFYLLLSNNHKTYDNLRSRLDQEGHGELVQGKKSLSDAEWSALQKNLDFISSMAAELPRHIETAGARQRELENAISKSFMGLCRRAMACLKPLTAAKRTPWYPLKLSFQT
jgi:hypothetical protein